MITPMQPFPNRGVLAANVNLTKGRLAAHVNRGAAYSYVLRSLVFSQESRLFAQHGSAPNFQGDVLTLCTCKHQMRASLEVSDWEKERWVVGLTSRCLHRKRHWLFYLAKVGRAYPSQADLWADLPAQVREAKSAQANYLGDVFTPRGGASEEGRFRPRNYHAPARHSHRRNSCDTGWHNDIDYWNAGHAGHPALLVFDPHLTFLWDEPVIWYSGDHCRNYKKWSALADLIQVLRD